MRRLIAIALLLLLGTFTLGAQTESKQTKKPPKQKTEMKSAAHKDIDAVRKAWEEAYNAKDAAKVADLYTDDATMASPGGVAEGKEQIRTALQKGIDDGQTIVAITPTRTEVKGDLAYEDGTFQQKKGDQEMRGNYLVVLKKVGTQWKLAAHNDVVPAPSETAKEKKE